MFTSEIVTWAHLTLWEFGNGQQGKNSLHNVYYNELFSLKTQSSINIFCAVLHLERMTNVWIAPKKIYAGNSDGNERGQRMKVKLKNRERSGQIWKQILCRHFNSPNALLELSKFNYGCKRFPHVHVVNDVSYDRKSVSNSGQIWCNSPLYWVTVVLINDNDK